MYNFQPNQTLKLYIYACTSGVYLHIKIVFLKSVFELEWSRLSCYHVAAPLIRSYSYGGVKIIKPSDWNMKQSELAVTVGAQMNEQRMYQYIWTWLGQQTVDLSTGDRDVGRRMWRRQRGQADHTGAKPGKLINSTVNGSTSDSPAETHSAAAGSARREYSGKRGADLDKRTQTGLKLRE